MTQHPPYRDCPQCKQPKLAHTSPDCDWIVCAYCCIRAIFDDDTDAIVIEPYHPEGLDL